MQYEKILSKIMCHIYLVWRCYQRMLIGILIFLKFPFPETAPKNVPSQDSYFTKKQKKQPVQGTLWPKDLASTVAVAQDWPLSAN